MRQLKNSNCQVAPSCSPFSTNANRWPIEVLSFISVGMIPLVHQFSTFEMSKNTHENLSSFRSLAYSNPVRSKHDFSLLELYSLNDLGNRANKWSPATTLKTFQDFLVIREILKCCGVHPKSKIRKKFSLLRPPSSRSSSRRMEILKLAYALNALNSVGKKNVSPFGTPQTLGPQITSESKRIDDSWQEPYRFHVESSSQSALRNPRKTTIHRSHSSTTPLEFETTKKVESRDLKATSNQSRRSLTSNNIPVPTKKAYIFQNSISHSISNDISSHRSNNSRKSIPRGLVNVGNSCFMNSTLQCFFSTPAIREILTKLSTKLEKGSNTPSSVLCRIFNAYESNEESKLEELLTLLARSFGKFCRVDSLDQQDPSELITYLFKDLEKTSDGKKLQDLFKCRIFKETICNTCKKGNGSSFIDELIWIVPPHKDLYTSLAQFLYSEIEGYECHRCEVATQMRVMEGKEPIKERVLTTARRICTKLELPKILLVQIQRNMNNTKDNTLVSIPVQLNFDHVRRLLGVNPLKTGKLLYDLYAVIDHAGKSPNHGHYTSFVGRDGKWWLCNDSVVTAKDMERSAKNYILFYKQR